MSDALVETPTGFEQADKVIVGVVADTHVPDRVDRLHGALLDTLKKKQVDIILHAGDICLPIVLEQLGTIAPVLAVKGNRDIYFINSLPMARIMCFSGHRLALVHGHGRWHHYFLNKIRMFFKGYHLNIFLPTILDSVPPSDVIVFGHTHKPVNIWYNGQHLLFNPGSCSSVLERSQYPTVGILKLEKDKKAEGEIVELKGERLKNRQWVNEKSNS
jgi:putative phosphoesterase